MKNLFILCCLPLFGMSQNSMIQDKSGETSLLLGQYNSLQFSSGDASVGANLSSYTTNASRGERFWGFSIKAKSNEGISKLLDGYQFKPKFEAGIFGGKYISPDSSTNATYFYGSTTVSNSYFKLLDKNAVNTFADKRHFGWRLKTGINRLGSIGRSSTLSGVSLEYGEVDNLDDLDVVDRYESVFDTSVTPNTTTLTNKTSGFSGEYKSGNQIRLNIDYLLFPHFIGGQLGVGGFFHGSAGNSFARQNIGFGLFLGQKGAPDKIVFGLVYQINDIFNQVSDEENFQKRTGISLNAGYNF